MLWWDEENKLTVFMPKGIWQKIVNFSERHFPNECGGILIGSYDVTLKTARIRETFVSKRNKASTCSLIREAAEANKILKLAWVLSFKKKYFIGEWHSHPNGNDLPSTDDDASLFKIAQNRKSECPRPILMIINGNKESGWKANRVWLYTREGDRLELMLVQKNISEG